MSSVVLGVGDGFLPYAPPVFERCVSIVRQCLVAYQAFSQDQTNELDEPDRTHLIVALDLLSGLTQALAEQSQSFFASSDVLSLMVACFSVRASYSFYSLNRRAERVVVTQYPEPPVKQSAFALLGDTAISCFPLLQPLLPEVMPQVVTAITASVPPDSVSVCNNAAWCAGEIAMKQGKSAIALRK